jgi:3-isopropylmalate dehydrogenase
MLLDWLAIRHRRDDLHAAARAIEAALDVLLADPARRTADLGGPLGTRAFTGALCREIAGGPG